MIGIGADCENIVPLKASKRSSDLSRSYGFIDGIGRTGERWLMQELTLVVNPGKLSTRQVAEQLDRSPSAVRSMRNRIKKTRQVWAR